jgi:hypothetical protein
MTCGKTRKNPKILIENKLLTNRILNFNFITCSLIFNQPLAQFLKPKIKPDETQFTQHSHFHNFNKFNSIKIIPLYPQLCGCKSVLGKFKGDTVDNQNKGSCGKIH